MAVFAATTSGGGGGGVVASEDAFWDMTVDEVDPFLCPPALERHGSSSWGLDPLHAATVVVANDNSDDDGVYNSSVDNGSGEMSDRDEPGANATAVVTAQQQRNQEERPAGWVKLPPAGDKVLFGWCKEVRDRSTRPQSCLYFTVCGIVGMCHLVVQLSRPSQSTPPSPWNWRRLLATTAR